MGEEDEAESTWGDESEHDASVPAADTCDEEGRGLPERRDSVVSATSKYLRPPTRLQRWAVRHRRAIHVVTAVYVAVALLIQALAVGHGETGLSIWVTTIGSVLVMVVVVPVLLHSVQQYVDRWDSSHSGDED